MQWFTTDLITVGKITLSVIGVFIGVVVFIRLNGLRTLSKMSSFDFAVTIAVGSLLAATAVSDSPSLSEGLVALGVLIACQRIVAKMRSQINLSNLIENSPVLLMDKDQYQTAAMRRSRVTKDDIAGKLREANVTQMSQVLAVVLESTGDISVLHTNNDQQLDSQVMLGVRNYDHD